MNIRWENKNGRQCYTKDPKAQEGLRDLWESIASEIMEKYSPRNLERPEKCLLEPSKSLKVVELISPEGKDQPYKSFVFVLSSLLTFKSYTQIKFCLWQFGVPQHLCLYFLFVCFVLISSTLSLIVTKKKKKKRKVNRILKLEYLSDYPSHGFTFKIKFFTYLN